MAEIKGIIQTLSRNYKSTQKLMIKLNSTLYGNIDRKHFITLIYSIINTDDRLMFLSRAGHTPLLHYSSETEKYTYNKSLGLGLGLASGPVFNKVLKEQRIGLSFGDIFVFYTDGITETFNAEGEEYGEDNLINTLYENKNYSANQIKNAILHNVSLFMGEANRFDDMTVVVVRNK